MDSILKQNFKTGNLEVICIDDGSTDDSLYIANKYAEKYSYIKVIEKENGGVGSARNLGIQNATGKYITFIDSDDYIMPESYKKCVEIMNTTGAESCSFPLKKVGERMSVKMMNTFLTWHKNEKAEMISSPSVCGKILLREIVIKNQIRFNEKMHYGEDTLFMYFISLYVNASRHIFIHEPIYYYRQHESSAMHCKSTESRRIHMQDMLEMAGCYKNALEEAAELSEYIIKNIMLRKNKSVANVLFDAALLKDIDIQKLLTDLKNEGFYPYSLAWWTLKPESLKNWIINMLSFFFPYSWYYKFYTFVIRKLV